MTEPGGLGSRSASVVNALRDCLEATREGLAAATREHTGAGSEAERARAEAMRNTTQRHRAERESELTLHEETRPMLERLGESVGFLAGLESIEYVDARPQGAAAQYDDAFELYLDLAPLSLRYWKRIGGILLQ